MVSLLSFVAMHSAYNFAPSNMSQAPAVRTADLLSHVIRGGLGESETCQLFAQIASGAHTLLLSCVQALRQTAHSELIHHTF